MYALSIGRSGPVPAAFGETIVLFDFERVVCASVCVFLRSKRVKGRCMRRSSKGQA